MRRLLLILLALLVTPFTTIGSTSAWFTDSIDQTGTLTSAQLNPVSAKTYSRGSNGMQMSWSDAYSLDWATTNKVATGVAYTASRVIDNGIPQPVYAGTSTQFLDKGPARQPQDQISLGGQSFVARGTNGRIVLAGSGSAAQPSAIQLPGGRSAKSVSAGGNLAVALATDGTVWSWSNQSPVPQQVAIPGTARVADVSAGVQHVAIRTVDGGIYEWGSNQKGELGNGSTSTTPNTNPQLVSLPNGVKAMYVHAGYYQTTAVGTDNSVWFWGFNNNGQGGVGDTTDRLVPTRVSAFDGKNVIKFDTSSNYGAALTASGAVFATAKDPSTSVATVWPVAVSRLDGKPAADIALGYYHAIVLLRNHDVWAWGSNLNGELGIGEPTGDATPWAPTQVSAPWNGDTPISIAAGGETSGVVTSTGAVYTWGYNAQGQLANGQVTSRNVPGSIEPGRTITDVAAGMYHVVALASDGTVWASGTNNAGQLGNGTTTNSSVPVQVVLPEGRLAASIAASQSQSFAVATDGSVWGWGYDIDGRLGDGTKTNQLTPVQVRIPSGVEIQQIASGQTHTLALTSSGKIYAWGSNDAGQLGFGNSTATTTPTLLPGDRTYTSISAGVRSSLAIDDSGQAYGWGLNNQGQVGNGNQVAQASPVAVQGGHSFTQVSSSNGYSLGVANDGTVWGWGFNQDNELGDGTTTRRSTPVQVLIPSYLNIVRVSAGNNHSLALSSDGRLVSWGTNGYGQLGIGTTSLQQAKPALVAFSSAPSVVAMVAGNASSVAVFNGGDLYGWGYNQDGRLGDLSTTNHSSPTFNAVQQYNADFASVACPPGTQDGGVACVPTGSLKYILNYSYGPWTSASQEIVFQN